MMMTSPNPKPRGFWKSKTNVMAEIHRAAALLGHPTVMPTDTELRATRLNSLAIMIGKTFGSYHAAALACGLAPNRNPYGSFDDLKDLCKALRDFAKDQGTPGLMPTARIIRDAEAWHLQTAIDRHHGFYEVAEKCCLTMSHDTKPAGFYDDFEAVADGVRSFIARTGTWGIMPSSGELCDAEESGLAFAINSHGGFPKTAVRLGLPPRRKPVGHWTPETTETEVLSFVSEYGEPGIFPTGTLLRACERTDIENALNDYPGGTRALADRLGLLMLGGKPNGYWENTGNIASELQAFVKDYGEDGVMPTQDLMLRHGRLDLVNALHRWAGG